MVLGTLYLRLFINYDFTRTWQRGRKAPWNAAKELLLPSSFSVWEVGRKAMILSLLFGSYFIFFTYHRYHSLKKHRSSRQATFDSLALSAMLQTRFFYVYVFAPARNSFAICYIWTCDINSIKLALLNSFLSYITNFLRAYKIISTIFMCANDDTFHSHAYEIFS